MRFIPFIIFFIYVYLEVSVFIMVANAIGVFLALVCIILTSIIGLSLVKSQGLKNFILMQQKIANNEDPTDEIVHGTSLLIAGVFLLIPGFLTDIIGVIFLLPPVQKMLAKFIVPKINMTTYFSGRKHSQYGNNNYAQFNIINGNLPDNTTSKNSTSDENIIEGEFKRKDDDE